MASNLRRSKRTVGRRLVDLQTKVSGLQKRVGPVSIGQNAVSTSSLQPGAVGGWVVDANSIYTGTKTATGSFAPTGSITIGSDGHITANKFRIDANGDAFFTGAISGGTIDIGGSDSSSFHVDASGNIWLGASTYASAPFKVSASGGLVASGANISGAISASSGNFGSYSIDGTDLFATDGNFDVKLSPGDISCEGPSNSAVLVNSYGIEASSDFGYWSINSSGDAEFAGGLIVDGGTDSYILNSALYVQRPDAAPVLHLERAYGAGQDFVRFRNATANQEVGRIEFSSTTTIVYQTSSDSRLKENIEPLVDAIETIKLIQPVKYNFISDLSNKIDGFLAQDLYNAYPQVVSVGGDDPKERPWAVNYAGITPILTAAIKEIIARLEDLESRS